MKKAKLLATLAAAAVLAVGGGVIAGCSNGHTHTYSTGDDWGKDATSHWHYATCDDLKEGDKDYKIDVADHVWGTGDSADKCTVCKYQKPASPATEISLNKTELALSIDKTEDTLEATLNGTGTVTWSSSDDTVVLVGETGAVEALKPGTATITATITGTEIKKTCAVTVADAYYIIGGMDSKWNKAGAFGGNFAYFMPTETEGVYQTNSFELRRYGNFQVAPVGDTTNDWYKKAFNGDYINAEDAVLSKNRGGNIAVQKHGKYTITLDLRGGKAVVSGGCDEKIDDDNVKDIYYIRGTANTTSGDNPANDVATAGGYVFTENNDGTHSLTVELARGKEFKVAIIGLEYDGSLAEWAVPRDLIGDKNTATVDTKYKLTWTDSDNICVGLSGRYTFTLDPDGGTHNSLSYTFEKTDETETAPAVLHYYIKGDALTADNGWNVGTVDAYELKETAADSGVYTITIELKGTGAFMFWACAEDKDGTVTEAQADYFNGGNTTLTAANDCVTVSGSNYAPAAAGWYTITLNPKDRTLNISYSATNPAE